MADSRTRQVSLGTLLLVGGLSGVLFWQTQQSPVGIVVAAAVLAAGAVVRVPTPTGGTLHVGAGVAAAVPLLFREVAAVGTVYGLGICAAYLLLQARPAQRRRAGRLFLSEVAGLSTLTLVFFLASSGLERNGLKGTWPDLAAVTLGAVTWFVVTSAMNSLIGYQEQRLGIRYLWLSSLGDWPVLVSLVASGALFGFSYPLIGAWAFPMATMPYGFSHLAFVRYHDTRGTYGQMIRALARIPEVAGLSADGHSARTADLAVVIGKELGLHPDWVAELEFAALMHDIGRITLTEPAILKVGYTDDDIARWGAQIIEEAPYLRSVAGLVAQQYEAYRKPGEERDPSVPRASQIIRVASAYDKAVYEMGLPPLEALEVLHRGAAYDFDPDIVRSLRKVVARRGLVAA
ncbi:MAG: HD-GYP domain-containing protein [Acidimicrobiia bacterium]